MHYKTSIMKEFVSQTELTELMNEFDLRDYFMYLVSRGELFFTRRYTKWFYFENQNQKFAVCKESWHDFKNVTEAGGKAIKAVMLFEKLNWLEAVHFIKDFLGKNYSFSEIETLKIEADKSHDYEFFEITKIIKPNHEKLIGYFEKRGISKQTLIDYARQIHFVRQVKGEMKHSFGIGFKNQSGGYEIKNEYMPTKLGAGDFSQVGNLQSTKIFVAEGMTDIFSMIEILKKKGRNPNEFRFVSLNSMNNTDSFLKYFKSQSLEFLLCLDGDMAGEKATQKMLAELGDKAQDIRTRFGIKEGGIKDLNDYWEILKKGTHNEKRG